ncbi:MAG: hypothetical protein HY820_16075 [Acidobacteria bacterium]|nr:hypothetical protein [Acidobacteriota bacterium]
MNNSFEVSFSLRLAVREISRPPKTTAPAAPQLPKYTRYPRITQVVALALQFQEMIDCGEIRQHSDLARLGCISRERVSQIMVLVWLAPDIQESVLRLPQVPGGRFPVSEGTLRKIASLPLWEDQREQWRGVLAGAGSGTINRGEA